MSVAAARRLGQQGRRWAGLLSYGLVEQVLISGSNFALTAVMAHYLGAYRFGWWSIGWAVLLLFETTALGLFGDGVPATANRLPAASLREFRGALVLLSTIWGTLVLGLALLAWPVAAALGAPQPGLIAATGLAFFALRAQNAMRRLYYLAGLRREAALAALLAVLVMAGAALAFLRWGGEPSAAQGMVIPALGSLAAAGLLLAMPHRLPLRRPDRALVRWALRRLWRNGRWLCLSSMMSFAGNFGLVIITGALMGVTMSGTLRVVMTLTVPPAQLGIVLTSIIVPRVAAIPRGELAARARTIALGATGLFGGASAGYAALITLVAPWLLPAMFTHSAEGVTRTVVAIATFGYALESIRSACNIVMLARGDTKIMFAGQTIAMAMALVLVPLATGYGLGWVVLAMVVANNSNTLVNLALFLRATAGPAKGGTRA